MTEGALLPVTEQPPNLGNAHPGFAKILLRKPQTKFLQNIYKAHAFPTQTPGESSVTDAETSSYVFDRGLAVWQQGCNHVFHL